MNGFKKTSSLGGGQSLKPARNKGFTLAEVLVTLGVIGVVASLTMPTLIDNHRKVVTETRLKKFYSLMSQAILKWEDRNNLLPEDVHFNIHNLDDCEKWYKNSIGPELKSVKEEKVNWHGYKVVLADGSSFYVGVNGKTMHFTYCIDEKYCKNNDILFDGKHAFLFTLEDGSGTYGGKLITSFGKHQTESREDLLNECKYGNTDDSSVSAQGKRHACTRLIEIDGWQIKEDYPWKQTMLEKNK